MGISHEKKREYFERLQGHLETYTRVLLIDIDNVGSKQIQNTRIALRGKAELIFGKNTLIRKVFTDFIEGNEEHPYAQLLPYIKGNVGFVFTNGDLNEIRELLESNKVPAPAKVGSFAPRDVVIPAGPTGCDPGQTSFFQTLNIATKISRGQIEIVSDITLVHEGVKVGSSEAVLLQKLSILPFSYGMVCKTVYDNGSVFDPAVLDLTDDDIVAKFATGLRNVAALSLEIGYPTLASIPHSLANAFKTLVAVAVECETFSFEKAEPFKAYLADPSAFAAAAGPASGAASAEVVVEEEEEEEEADVGGGMDMFGGGSDY